MRTRVKFCGCETPGDVARAQSAGAHAFGMIFAPSPRRISLAQARAIALETAASITPVGVFVDPTIEEIDAVRAIFPSLVVQLSGDESPDFVSRLGGTVIKAIHVEPDASDAELEARCNRYPASLVMFDTKVAGSYGGTGQRFDWSKIARLSAERAIVVAGGLTPENVGECVRSVHPAWVDVRSGVENDGRKDIKKMQRFVTAVRENDAA